MPDSDTDADAHSVHPDDSHKLQDINRKLTDGLRNYELDYRTISPHGELRYFREIGEVVEPASGNRICMASIQDVTDRQLIVDQLNESRRRLTTLMGNLPGMAYRCRNDEQYTMEYVSHGCRNLTGYRPSELIQNLRVAFVDLIVPDADARCRSVLETARSNNEPFTLEYQLKTASGETKWVWEHGVAVPDPNGENSGAIEGYIVDITDTKTAELERRLSDTRFRDFSRVAADWFWEMGADLCYTYVSGRFEEVMGIPPQEIIGVSRRELHQKYVDSTDTWTDRLKQLEAREPFKDFEIIWRHPQHAPRHVQISGTPFYDEKDEFLGYRGVGRDITTQKRLESQLNALLKLSPDAIVIADRDGTIRFANAVASKLLGYRHDELIGFQAESFLPPADRVVGVRLREEYFKAPDTRMVGTEREILATRKDGTEFPIELGLSPIEDAGETLVLITIRDISERRQNEAQRQRQLRDHAHGDRLSTAGQLASGLAHELNQPLSAISNNCETGLQIVNELRVKDPDLTEILQENFEYAQRAGQIIHSLRKLVQKGRQRKVPVDINSLITETSKLIGPEARAAQVQIKLKLANRLPLLELDVVQIQQVLVNLQRNAIEALSQCQDRTRKLTIYSSWQDADSVEITVKDNGVGICPSVADDLFQPYTTSREDGMGLGLAISQSMIASHGGRLWFEKTESEGAVFCFSLPLKRGDQTASDGERYSEHSEENAVR